MSRSILIALAAMITVPTGAQAAAPTKATAAPAEKAKKPPMDPMVAMAMMTKMFDKFFPAGPEPDPARLAMARQATMTMFPKGAYAQAMNGFVDRTVDRVLSMSEADFMDMMPPSEKKKGKVPSTEPLRVMLAKKEPMFDAKLAAGKAFAATMFTKFSDVMEPKFREGMSRSLARKFDAKQMAEIQAFLATPTGAAYGREMVGLWFEPDVMRGSLEGIPEMMKLMPDVMKDAAAFDAQMKAKPADAKKPE